MKNFLSILLILSLLSFTAIAKNRYGASLSYGSDGFNQAFTVLPSFVFENDFIVAGLGFGFQSSELKLENKNLEKGSNNPFFIEGAFKLNMKKNIDFLYGTRFVFSSGKYNGNRLESSSKIALTGGLLYTIDKNLKLSFIFDAYSTNINEWKNESNTQEEVMNSAFLQGGKFSLIYMF